MRKNYCGRAAILTFVAHLLDVDLVSSSSSSSSRSPFARPSSRLSLSFELRPSSTRRMLLNSAFVHQWSRCGQEIAGAGNYVSSATKAPSSRHSRGHRIRTCIVRPESLESSSAVAPRYYKVDASYSQEAEFSLLRPHLEFSELDLQHLFMKRAGAEGPDLDRSASSSSKGPSQLYEEFEEVEISRFQQSAAAAGGGGGGGSGNRKAGGSSPFFFASHQPETFPPQARPETSPQKIGNGREDFDTETTTTLPPWLSLNSAHAAPMKLQKLRRDLTSHLSNREIERVVSAIRSASCDDLKKVAGAADFCSLLVNSLEMTDVSALCAAAFHYASSVSVRERELSMDESCPVEVRECLHQAGADAKYLCALAGSGIEDFGSHSVKIALDTARLKSMESLAAAVMRKNGRLGPLRSGDARNLRSLLLTVNEEGDWRALAIRSAACLYRLKGLEAYRATAVVEGTTTTTTSSKEKTRSATPEESRMSQEALHIYAPFAARLGMFRLKTELEDAAFRILYPRSHAKVSGLCGGENTNSVGEGMKSILSDISNQVKRLVQEDCSFMDNIENVSVMARVKEPYSVWRKMLKIVKEGNGPTARSMSILDIPDALATRVVFSARKLSPDESDSTTQHREEELCYYLFDLCRRNWPETADSRFKDYVKNPKPNGYQSLHYSSRKRWRGTEWPFELQIRSRTMHRVAEYGVAAHCCYKYENAIDDGDILSYPPTATFVSTQSLDKTSEAFLKSSQEWRAKQARQNAIAPPSSELKGPALHLEEEIRRQRKRDRDSALAPYLEALSGAQSDIMRKNVFVFVSVQPPMKDSESSYGISPSLSLPPCEGTVLSLPQGSRVLDAIRLTEKWSSTLSSGSGNLYDGRSSFVALCNGKRTSTMGTEFLKSGDFVSILPSSELVSSKRSFQ
ncbi:hypothetical protein ACHAXA_007210 [Cyclostephanos tholiformis]|uniref:RelA/SpoT domain-containing protein n=1 Tax=Cyclostephanos tholiformis TaxID=382380 RepID=A0ABD3SG49_9STRA